MAHAGYTACIYAHRGASALLPEHTLAAYTQAISDGADCIELDVVPSADGVLVVRHENELSATTNVADMPQFRERKTHKWIDGQRMEGWFTEDFSWHELQQLRVRERFPLLRGTAFDDLFGLVQLEEVIALIAAKSTNIGRMIGLAPEIKHPTYFREIGLELESRMLSVLAGHRYTQQAPVTVQCFEPPSLQQLRDHLPRGGNIALLQLVGKEQSQLLEDASLTRIACYADILGPDKTLVIPRTASGGLGEPTAIVQRAHAYGLQVVPWTFRPEHPFLPSALCCTRAGIRQETAAVTEMQAYLATGIDGLMSDDPALAVRALQSASCH